MAKTTMVVGVVAAAAVCGAIAWAMMPSTRFAYGVAPIGEGEAILVTRRNEDHATYFWAQLVRRDGTVVWSAETSPVRTDDALGFTGVVADETHVVLLGEHEDKTAVLALDRANGERRWEIELGAGPPNVIADALILDPPRVYVLHDPPDRPPTITALALHDGSTSWSTEIGESQHAAFYGGGVALLAPGRLAVAGSFSDPGIELDGERGVVAGPLPMHRIGCETPTALVGFADDDTVRLPRPGAEGEVGPQRLSLRGARGAYGGPCGERDGDAIVVALDHDDRIMPLRIDPSSGTPRWLLDLGDGVLGESVSRDGRLPRLLPVVVSRSHPEGRRTVVVDLDTGEILGEHAHEDDRMVFVTADRAFVMGLFSPTVFALDPVTGALAWAGRFEGTIGDEVRVQDFRFGELWLTGRGRGRPDALSWAVLDLASASVTARHGEVVVTDVGALGWAGR
jgi:outer membrane protein assembly factor BamB